VKGCERVYNRFMNKLQRTENPYTLQFSYIPPRIIERTVVTSEIIDNYLRDLPTYRGMFLTGVRGSGKTVMLGSVRNSIASNINWITVDINPESNILDSLARRLYMIPELKALFIKAKLDFSVLGLGLHIEDSGSVATTEEDALYIMLKALKTAGKRVLVTVDEVTYSKDVAMFSHALSSFSNEGYEIYVLMTGLMENIRNIKNKKSLTFLYRAKIKELGGLNLNSIGRDYKETLGVDEKTAKELADITRGYSLGFQALGYHYYNELCEVKDRSEVNINKVLSEFDATLAELSYDKIWDELSATDIKILKAMLEISEDEGEVLIKVDKIRERTEMSSDTFTKYRTRLLDSGVVDGSTYGHLKFSLPRFEEYIRGRG